MSDITTVTLDGGELKVEGLGGQNTVIVNRGSGTIYASAFHNIEPYGDNVAAIPAGGVMNLYDTHGTVYLLGTGKAELTGTDYADLPVSAAVVSGGGGGGSTGGVSQSYVDDQDALILSSAKKYTDTEIEKVKMEIPEDKTLTAPELAELLEEVFGSNSDTEILLGLPMERGLTIFDRSTCAEDLGTTNLWPDLTNTKFIKTTGASSANSETVFLERNASYGIYESSEMPVVVYFVGRTAGLTKLNTRCPIVSKHTDTQNSYLDFHNAGMDGMSGTSNVWIPRPYIAMDDNYTPPPKSQVINVDTMSYHVYAFVMRSNTVDLYIDGEKKISTTSDNVFQHYGGSMIINASKRGDLIVLSENALTVYFIAFGSVVHTEDEIKANSDWLKIKYLGG